MQKVDFIHIEDLDEWQNIVRMLIEGEFAFHNFISVATIEDAIRVLRKKPTIIIVDFQLNDKSNDFEGLHWLIDNAPQAIQNNTEVIVLSAHTSPAITSVLVSRGVREDQIFDKRTKFEEQFLQAISKAISRLSEQQLSSDIPTNNVPQIGNETTVFISHSSKDSTFANRISRDIKDIGLHVWKAPESILPGEGWVEAIQRGLQRSSFVILIVSPLSVASKWVNLEVELAIQLEREGKITIIPVYYKESTIPLLWSYFQAVDFKKEYEEAIQILLKRLQNR